MIGFVIGLCCYSILNSPPTNYAPPSPQDRAGMLVFAAILAVLLAVLLFWDFRCADRRYQAYLAKCEAIREREQARKAAGDTDPRGYEPMPIWK